MNNNNAFKRGTHSLTCPGEEVTNVEGSMEETKKKSVSSRKKKRFNQPTNHGIAAALQSTTACCTPSHLISSPHPLPHPTIPLQLPYRLFEAALRILRMKFKSENNSTRRIPAQCGEERAKQIHHQHYCHIQSLHRSCTCFGPVLPASFIQWWTSKLRDIVQRRRRRRKLPVPRRRKNK